MKPGVDPQHLRGLFPGLLKLSRLRVGCLSTASKRCRMRSGTFFGVIATTGDWRKGAVMDWARLAYVTGTVDQELSARNEYLATENRILKDQLKGRLMLSDAERATLGEIGHRLGRKVLAEVATVARPDTILAWYRKLVARKFSGSQARQGPGRPRLKRAVEQLIIRMASENRDWGYDRIAGAMANLGYVISDQTVGNVLRRNGLPPAPERKRTTPWSVMRLRRTASRLRGLTVRLSP